MLVGTLVLAACNGGDGDDRPRSAGTSTTAAPAPTTTAPAPTTTAAPGPVVARFASAGTRVEVSEVARRLDTVWALAWDPSGRLWYTERGGRLTRLGDPPQAVAGVQESGEAGLMGLEIDGRGRRFVMYTGARDNRIVRLEADGTQRVLVSGIARAAIHDGGRLRFGPDGMLFAGTGDASNPSLAPDRDSLSGKVLRIDPETGRATVFSRGHRNVQGLCFAPDGRFLATEHGPDRGDEVNALAEGFDGGWPDKVANGIRNYTPSVAPAGCDVYDAGLIPAWKGSMLFVTLRGRSLHRLTFRPDGSVASDEVLLDGTFGRLRDVRTGPDGAVYVATSNRDGRGQPAAEDDRILRIAPAPPAPAAAPTTSPPPRGTGATTAEGPADAASAAATLTRTETGIRDPATPDAALEKLGQDQQVAYRRLVEHPEWMAEVLDRVPASLRPTIQANVTAGAELRALTKPRTELPPWRIVQPAPAAELLGYYKEAEAQMGVPWQYLAAIHLVETRMGRIRGTSTAGAQGPMQFLPATWGQYGAGGDINSNRDSILAAARLLARNGAPADMARALFNYTRSQRYVTAVTAYAEQMRRDERAYLGYYHWQVFYRLVEGDRLLPVGYGSGSG